MSEYVNVGAFVDGKRPRSKKALLEAIRRDPQSVRFDGTSPHGPQFSGLAVNLPTHLVASVTGPDPETKRVWYAQVKWNTRSGKLVVS